MILSEQTQIARYNIGRKAVPNAFVADGIEGVDCTRRSSLFDDFR
jgi:hypothetical protein